MCYQEHVRFKIQINQLYAESTKQWCRDGDHVKQYEKVETVLKNKEKM